MEENRAANQRSAFFAYNLIIWAIENKAVFKMFHSKPESKSDSPYKMSFRFGCVRNIFPGEWLSPQLVWRLVWFSQKYFLEYFPLTVKLIRDFGRNFTLPEHQVEKYALFCDLTPVKPTVSSISTPIFLLSPLEFLMRLKFILYLLVPEVAFLVNLYWVHIITE